MKKIKIMLIVLCPFFLNASTLSNICSDETALNNNLVNKYYKEYVYDYENDIETEKKLKTVKNIYSKLYDESRINTQKSDLKEEKKETIIFKKCDLNYETKKFFTKEGKEKIGIYSYLAPNFKYYEGDINIEGAKKVQEERKKYLISLIFYGKKNNNFIFPIINNTYKELIKKIRGEKSSPTKTGKIMYQMSEDVAKQNVNLIDNKVILLKKVIGVEEEGEEELSDDFLKNLSMLGENIYLSTKSFIDSGNITVKKEERKELKNVLNNINIKLTNAFERTKEKDPFAQRCELERANSLNASLKNGFNLNVSEQLQKAKDQMDELVSETLDKVEDFMLYYTSDEFIIGTAVDMVITGVSKARCTLMKTAESKGLPLNASNVLGGVYVLSTSAIKKACEEREKTNDQAGKGSTVDQELCVMSINKVCKVDFSSFGYFGFGGGGTTINNSEKKKGCQDFAEMAAEELYPVCVKETRNYITQDIQRYLNSLIKMIFKNQSEQFKCTTKKDVLFKLSTKNDLNNTLKKKAIAMVNDANCGSNCKEMRENLESQGITTNSFITKIELENELNNISKLEKAELERIMKLEEKNVKSFEIKINDYLGKLKKENKHMNNYMYEALEVSKQMLNNIYINSRIKSREYFSYWIKQLNSTSRKQEIINNFNNLNISISDNSYYKSVINLHNNIGAQLLPGSSLFNEDVTSEINKRIEKMEKNIINKVSKMIADIYNSKSFIFVPSDLSMFGINTTYNLPFQSVLTNSTKKLVGLLVESDPKISSRDNKEEELLYYNPNDNNSLLIEKTIENQIKEIEESMSKSGEKSILLKDTLLKNLEKTYENKILSMVIYEMMSSYGKDNYVLSNLLLQMDRNKKVWFESKLYQLYKIIKY